MGHLNMLDQFDKLIFIICSIDLITENMVTK